MTLKKFCKLIADFFGVAFSHRRWADAIKELEWVLLEKSTLEKETNPPERYSFSSSAFSGVIDLRNHQVVLIYATQLKLDFDVPGTRFEFWWEGKGQRSEPIWVDGDYYNYASARLALPAEAGVYFMKCNAYRGKKRNDPDYAPDWIQMNASSHRVRIAA